MIRNAISKVTSNCTEDNGKAPNPDLEEVRRDRGVNSQGKFLVEVTLLFSLKKPQVGVIQTMGRGTKGLRSEGKAFIHIHKYLWSTQHVLGKTDKNKGSKIDNCVFRSLQTVPYG